MYLNNPIATPILRTRVGRIAWSLLAHPVKSREFPAKQERLVTPDELMRYGFSGFCEPGNRLGPATGWGRLPG